MLKKITCLALTLALCLSLVTVPAKAAVVEGTSALAATALYGYFTSTGVPLTVIEGGATAASSAIITDFAAATGVSAAETTATIASGVTIGTGGTIIIAAAAVAVCAAIAAWVISNRPSGSGSSSQPLVRGSGVIQNLPGAGKLILASDWFPISSSLSDGFVVGSFEGKPLTFVKSSYSGSTFLYNAFTWNGYNYLYTFTYGAADFIAFCYRSYSYFTDNNFSLEAVAHYLDGHYEVIGPRIGNAGQSIPRVLSNFPSLNSRIETPNPGSYITHNGSNSPLELPPKKSLSIQMPPDFPLSTGTPDPSSPEIPLIDPWLDNAYGPSPLVTPNNAPNFLVDSPDPDPGPDPLPDVDYDPPSTGGDDTEPPEDPDADNPFFVPRDIFLGVWHYVVEAFEYALPFLLGAVAAWNAMVPTSLQTVFYAAVVLAAVFGLIRRLMD